jgi:HEAT repeat protein
MRAGEGEAAMSQHARFIEKWVGYLNDIDREMSLIAAQKLGSTRDASVVPELLKALHNRPDDVRTAAIRALGEIGDGAAVPALIDILHDPNPVVASASADALGMIGDARAVPHLVTILHDYKAGNSRYFQIHGFNRGLFMAAVQALQIINTPEARRAIAKYHR